MAAPSSLERRVAFALLGESCKTDLVRDMSQNLYYYDLAKNLL